MYREHTRAVEQEATSLMQDVKSVAIVQRVIVHYRLTFYRRLSDILAKKGIRLTVFAGYARPEEAFRDGLDELECGIRVCNRYLYGDIYWQPLFGRLKAFDLVIVEQANSALLNYPLLLRRKWTGSSPLIAYWGHGATLHKGQAQPVRDNLKRFLTRQADWWFAYTDLSHTLVAKVGFPEGRICVVNNSTDTADISAAYEACANTDRASIRNELGLHADGPVLVYCGRLYENKALPFLIESCRIARERLPNLSLLVIGGGELENWLENEAGKEVWIKPVGAKYGQEKAHFLMAGDIFVLPSHVGLSILDGFAAGLPVVVARFNNHCPEITYLQDAINGLLTDPTPDAYAEALIRLAMDEALRKKMGAAAQRTAAQYSVQGMAENFAEGVERALGMHQHD